MDAHDLSNKIKAGTAVEANGETLPNGEHLSTRLINSSDKMTFNCLNLSVQRSPPFPKRMTSKLMLPHLPTTHRLLMHRSLPALHLVPLLFQCSLLPSRIRIQIFINAVATQRHKLSAEELFTLAELAHSRLKCLMPFQQHISRSGLCDSPALTPGMLGYQPRDVKWVNEWTHLNPAGFENCNAGAPPAAPRVPYMMTQDTIQR